MRGLVADSVIRAARARSTAPVGRVPDPERPAQSPLLVSASERDTYGRPDDQRHREAERHPYSHPETAMVMLIVLSAGVVWLVVSGIGFLVWTAITLAVP